MDDPAGVLIEVEHPEACEAASCTVPAFSDVLITVPTPRGGRRYYKRICLGHYLAFQVLIRKLVPRYGGSLSMKTAAEVEQERRAEDAADALRYTYGAKVTGTAQTFNSTSSSFATNAFFFRN